MNKVAKKINEFIKTETFAKILKISTFVKIIIISVAALAPIFMLGRKRLITILIEVGIIFMATQIFGKKRKKTTYFISSVLFLLILINTGSMIFAGNFVTFQMINNIGNFSALGSSTTLYIFASILAIIISFLPMDFNLLKIDKKIYKIFFINNVIWFYICTIFIPNLQTPLVGFGETVYNGVSINIKQRKIARELKSKEVEILNQFKKDSTQNAINIDTKDMNVILIFTEGLSEKVIESNEKYPGLTPNILAFREKSWNFDNYWNHTSATYKGLRGGLYSSQQIIEGYERGDIEEVTDTELIGLPEILNERGYNTTFINTQPKHKYFAPYVETLGFDNYPKREISEENGYKSVSSDNPFLTDEATYEELFDQAIEMNKKDEPFLISTYTLETHAGFNTDLTYGDGKNEYLNKFHNMDTQFGEFYEKFEKSELAENTIIIFTTDHASYATPDFTKTFENTEYTFFDKIPLMILVPGEKAKSLNAKNSNSLTLAPTILDLLNYEDTENYFLGTTLFDENQSVYEHQYVEFTDAKILTSRQGFAEEETDQEIIRKLEEFTSISLNLK